MGPIVDTHTHVVSSDRTRYPLQPRLALNWFDEHPVTVEQLLDSLDKAGVHGAVLVHPTAYGFDNRYTAAARQVAPGRLANVSIIDMEAPDRVERLTYWATEAGMLGTRLFNIPPASPPWLDDPATAAVLDQCRHLGLRITVCVLTGDLVGVGGLLALAPDLPMALEHGGFVDLTGGPPYRAAAALAELATYDNLRLKVTTTMLAPAVEAGGDARDIVGWLCDTFGVDRLMWGSDYPQHHREPYPDIVDLGRHACSWLNQADQERFLGGTALSLWPELAP